MSTNRGSLDIGWSKWKALIHGALNNTRHPNFKTLEWSIIICTTISVLVTIISTVPEFSAFHRHFLAIEVFCSVFFMLEYIARLLTSADKKAYVFSIWGFSDLMSFLPVVFILTPLPAFIFAQQVKILLAFRSLRIAKLARVYILEARSAASEEQIQENHSRDTPVSIYFLTQVTAAILNGAIMFEIEGAQAAYSTMPLAILEVSKILLDSDPVPPQSLFGRIFILFIYFQRLCLLGLLIDVMGGVIRRKLFGHSK
jgi:voltage-gated potassium channel